MSQPLGPLVKAVLTGRVAIVTGANTGLGFEAVKHLASMDPKKLIMTSRNEQKGLEALKRVKAETGFERVELGILDQSSFESVKTFADKVIAENDRLDLVLENAGVNVEDFVITKDGYEESLQVNTLSPALLTLLLLPLLKRTAKENPTTPPRITIVSSSGHAFTTLDDELIRAPVLREKMSEKEYSSQKLDPGTGPMAAFMPSSMMERRYQDVKLFNVFFAQTLHSYLSRSPSPIIVNTVDPGWCQSDLLRNITGERAVILAQSSKLYASTAEEGGRSIVYGLTGKKEDVDGKYLNCMKAVPTGEFVNSTVGRAVRERLWSEIKEVSLKIDQKVVQEVIETLAA